MKLDEGRVVAIDAWADLVGMPTANLGGHGVVKVVFNVERGDVTLCSSYGWCCLHTKEVCKVVIN